MTRISVGKLRGLQQISDDTGRFTMIAMHQRGSLQKMLHPENPKAASSAMHPLFFNPDAPRKIVDHQLKVVKRGADECNRLDLAFGCEPMSYAVDMSDEEFARKKADTIIRTAEILSPLGFDVLKAEFPGDPKVTPDPDELRKNCERLSRATT